MATDKRRISERLAGPSEWLVRRLSGDKEVPSHNFSGDVTPDITPVGPLGGLPKRSSSLAWTDKPFINAGVGIPEHGTFTHPLLFPPEQHPDYPHEDGKRYFLRLHNGAYQIWPLRCRKPPPSPTDPDAPTSRPSPAHEPQWQPERPGPANTLPPELWIHILSYLDADEALALRPTSHTLASVALDASLHRHVVINLGKRLRLTPAKRKALQHVKHIRVSSRTISHTADPLVDPSVDHPTRRLVKLLRALPAGGLRKFEARYLERSIHCGRWRSELDWDHWRPWLETEFWRKFWREMVRVGSHLEALALVESGMHQADWMRWGPHLGCCGRGLRHLNVSHNQIRAIPFSEHWALKSLSIAHTRCVDIATILREHPSLLFLDASDVGFLRISNVLEGSVVRETEGGLRLTALREIRLLDNDRLTIRDVQSLQAHWTGERAQCRPAPQFVEDASHPTTPRGRAWSINCPHDMLLCSQTSLKDDIMCKHARPPPRPKGTLAIVHNAVLYSHHVWGVRQYVEDLVNGTRAAAICELWV